MTNCLIPCPLGKLSGSENLLTSPEGKPLPWTTGWHSLLAMSKIINFHLPVAECPPVAPAVAGVGLGSGGGPLPGLTGECGMGLGGRRGGPDILFEAVEEKPGIGGGGFLGGELGTNKK